MPCITATPLPCGGCGGGRVFLPKCLLPPAFQALLACSVNRNACVLTPPPQPSPPPSPIPTTTPSPLHFVIAISVKYSHRACLRVRYLCIHARTYARTHVPTTHTHTRARAHAHTHARHTHTHARARATHTHTHARHAHTHTHTQSAGGPPVRDFCVIKRLKEL